METRIALAACLVLSSALCGKAASDAVRRRADALDGLSEGLRGLRIHMLGMAEPVQRALEGSDCPVLKAVGEGMKSGRSAGEVWKEGRHPPVRRGGPGDALSEADLRVLDRVFERLGQTGREEQEALLEAAIKAVEQLRTGARKRAEESERLYLSLGLLVGIMLALTVI